MAIRQVGNTVIVDATGLLSTQPATSRNNYKINAVGFFSIDSSARINIAMAANTTNIIFPLATNINTPNFEIFTVDSVYADEINVITVTAGTAYLYLG